jgi:hypothetical protein
LLILLILSDSLRALAAEAQAVLELLVAARLLGLEAIQVFEEKGQENGYEESDNH